MAQKKRAEKYARTCTTAERFASIWRTRYTATSAAAAAGIRKRREYQRSLSKQMMNDNKYRLSGSTQRNGTLATSRQTWFVVANNRIEGTIARANHKNSVPFEGRTAVAAEAGTDDESTVDLPAVLASKAAQSEQSTANATKPQDQYRARIRVAYSQSKTAG